jgi:hypothetical protein
METFDEIFAYGYQTIEMVKEDTRKLVARNEEKEREMFTQVTTDKFTEEPWQPLSAQELYNARLTNSPAWKRHLEETAKVWN